MISISDKVKNFYERRPYPGYPLFARPIWQEGILGASYFARHLLIKLKDLKDRRVASHRVLNLGCGEIQPYILRKLEPLNNELVCVDFSRQSLRRAKFRLIGNYLKTHFILSDIDDFLDCPQVPFDHCDAYGVLHHMEDPVTILKKISKNLRPGSTLRLMFYNGPSRQWLFEIQDHLLEQSFDGKSNRDVKMAQTMLRQLAQESPTIQDQLQKIGPETLRNKTRFADTFLHPQVIRWTFSDLEGALKEAGFTIYGLFDRYAELDDHPNTLWQLPSVRLLNEMSSDGRFENNYEVYAYKDGLEKSTKLVDPKIDHLKLVSAPRFWFEYLETRNVKPSTRKKIWDSWILQIKTGQEMPHFEELSPPARARLERLGAIFPCE